MERYQYAPLEGKDIRLITLLPGKREDPIQITITHTPLQEKIAPRLRNWKLKLCELRGQEKLNLTELQETLPPGWKDYKTREARILFDLDAEKRTSWDHPDPNYKFHKELYEPPERPMANIWFEALSYCWGHEDSSETIYVLARKSSSMKVQSSRRWENPLLQAKKALEPVGTIRTRRNLVSSLRYLRDERLSRTLWIDSLSIDQDNLHERSMQV